MGVPQHILDQFVARADYLEWINAEPALFVYLDLTNMFHWQNTLGWKFRLEDLIEQLYRYPSIKEIKVYYGLNKRDLRNSEAFHNRIRKTGAVLRSKIMKFIPKMIHDGMFFQRKTLTSFDDGVRSRISELVGELQKSGVVIEEPKCNFDVEMTMDILDDVEKFTGILLFSGDSDLLKPLERLKIKEKKVGVVGVRHSVAGELHRVKDKYFDFGKLYIGKKTYLHSENPAKSGTA